MVSTRWLLFVLKTAINSSPLPPASAEMGSGQYTSSDADPPPSPPDTFAAMPESYSIVCPILPVSVCCPFALSDNFPLPDFPRCYFSFYAHNNCSLQSRQFCFSTVCFGGSISYFKTAARLLVFRSGVQIPAAETTVFILFRQKC